LEDITGSLGKRFESFAKDMEPKLQKITEVVAEKLVSGTDRISRSLSTGAPADRPSAASRQGAVTTPDSPRAPRPAPAGALQEKNIELTVSAGYNELNLSGLNGNIRIKGYNGDKITARISYKAKKSASAVELMRLGAKYFLKYEEDDFEHIDIDAFVPERMFQIINIEGLNGGMDISSLAAREMRFDNAGGAVCLAGLSAENLRAVSGNGKMSLLNIVADNAAFENFNGSVDAEELDIANLSLVNGNGGLSVLMTAFNRYESYIWAVETSNAKLSLNVPTLPNLGYHIKAHATLGEIRVGLTGLQFLINDPALVEARTTSFDKAAKRVKLAAETSNAPLVIN
jgi:DUF4097 and DUF4098 domain-containing protein YvlB